MRAAEDAFPKVNDYFDPPLYTNEELEFIRDHVGETSYIALETAEHSERAIAAALQADAITAQSPVKVKRGVRNDRPSAMKSLQATCGGALQRFHQLMEMSKQQGTEWVVTDVKSGRSYPGVDGVKGHINRWLKRQEGYLERKRSDPEGKGFHPEMWTVRDGQPKWSGRGTDSERVRYPLALVPVGKRSYDDFTQEAYKDEEAPEVAELSVNSDIIDASYLRGDNFFECPVDGCNHRSNFDADSEMSENAALHGLRVHMSRPKGRFKVEEHQELKDRVRW